MKIFIDKGYLVKRYLLMMVISLSWLACEESREIKYSESDAIVQQHADPYLQILTGFIPFEVATVSYDLKFNVINGVDAIEEVNFYKTFFDSGLQMESNEMLVATYSGLGELRTVLVENLTYAELADGLLVNGAPLPASDVDIVPGSGWSFRFEGVDASGNVVPLLGAINMVLSKYAGNYEVIESSYFRIGVDNGDWNGQVVFMGFVDEVTLSHNDFWGPFGWAGKSFHFSFDPDDLSVEVPILTADGQIFGDSPLSCATDKSLFKNVPCDGSNKIVDDEGGPGAHRIYLTYGYFTDGSGSREFYEVLEKVVN